MASEVHDRDGNVVAVRFAHRDGPAVQMEVSEFEFPSWADVMVHEEASPREVRFADWVEEMRASGRNVMWDNAVRQNEMARNFENHRWADEMPGFRAAAVAARQRARVMVRDSMRVVA